jgi:hypothetical protein
MTPIAQLKPEFVTHVPDELEDGVLYVSMPFATTMHRCCCGCGREVVTPLSPTDWALTYNGESISLSRSIGNWNFPCQSHYWIDRSRVRWAPRWARERIDLGRAADREAKAARFGEVPSPDGGAVIQDVTRPGLLRRLVRRLRG